ncbi:MAG: beta-N-acetylhexosaminidase [Alloprevotella sp.]
MKNKIYSLLLLLALVVSPVFAQDFINLTPKAKTMQTSSGQLVLPATFGVSTVGLSDAMKAEVEKFVADYNAATGSSALAVNSADDALVKVELPVTALAEEAYTLSVTAEGVTIQASTATGLFYAFQTVKKILPPNVMAGVRDEAVTTYALPLVEISDEPRFGYRGFMLDVSRHFFDVQEIKRVLDVMSYYKMNRFHWHLTDDHGWRAEIKKYPKLTTVGSIADNNYIVDMKEGGYWQNKPYGPYFYTQEEMREVVAYAKKLHIEIIPEVDMPGHFCAAMASYPEYSCSPSGNHNVISAIGGMWTDVMNVANPEAVQFAQDILAELMDIFPYEYIHIGGDECPTTAWESNALCQAEYAAQGYSSYRQLQSEFIRQMGEFVQSKGRKLAVWNESITAGGADTQKVVDVDATVYCWVGANAAATKSVELGLHHIYTPQSPYYINRKQSTDSSEPQGAGPGNDNLQAVYQHSIPVPAAGKEELLDGVQATFWCEYVGFNDYLEYLMLPRLLAIAEAGWTPQAGRTFEDFRQRVAADSTLFNYNNYTYGKHYMTDAAGESGTTDKVMPAEGKWYRLVTKATAERADKCIELLRESSPLITQWSAKNARANRLWTNAQAEESDEAYNYQFWAVEEDPDNAGKYALVCKAVPAGSVNPVPTAAGTSGRWDYDATAKHYNFVLANNGYGQTGDNYYYSLQSDQATGVWMNASLAGQGYAVNAYGNPADGNGGLWTFVPQRTAEADASLAEELSEARTVLATAQTYADEAGKAVGLFAADQAEALAALLAGADLDNMTGSELEAFATEFHDAYAALWNSFVYPEVGKTYRVSNTTPDFFGNKWADNGVGSQLRYVDNTEVWVDDAWQVTAATVNADHTQTLQLRNTQSGRFVGAAATSAVGRLGYAVSVASEAADLTLVYNPLWGDFLLRSGEKNLFTVPVESTSNPGTIFCGSTVEGANANRKQGAAWTLAEVNVLTFECVDEEGQPLGTYRCSVPVSDGEGVTAALPVIPNFEYVNMQEGKYVYRRVACLLTVTARDQRGAIIARDVREVGVGDEVILEAPEYPFYTFASSSHPIGAALEVTADLNVDMQYTTHAYNGVKQLADAVAAVEAGKSYVLYDTSPSNTDRIGYRNVNASKQVWRALTIDDTDPLHTWLLEESGEYFRIKNEWEGLYVPAITTAATPVALAAEGVDYAFILNADGATFKIKCVSNGVCWDGLASGAMVGWNDPGHPYKAFEYYAQPYFEVLVAEVDTDGNVLSATTRQMVKAGETFTLSMGTHEGYSFKEIQGGEGLASVSDNLDIKVVFQSNSTTGIEAVENAGIRPAVYDLSGRRVGALRTGGIYIVDGQKVYVK